MAMSSNHFNSHQLQRRNPPICKSKNPGLTIPPPPPPLEPLPPIMHVRIDAVGVGFLGTPIVIHADYDLPEIASQTIWDALFPHAGGTLEVFFGWSSIAHQYSVFWSFQRTIPPESGGANTGITPYTGPAPFDSGTTPMAWTTGSGTTTQRTTA